MTPARTPPAQQPKERIKQLLYLDKSTPEEFQNAELMDWIYLVGDISTQYELDFVRQFGHAMKSRTPPAQQPKAYCISCGHCKQEETGFKTKRPRCEITRWFLDMYSVQEMISKIGCRHDTRSRPHPAPALNEDTWDPAIHGYCGDLQKVKAELEELKTVNAMLEAEVDRLTGIETGAARQAREDFADAIDEWLNSDDHLSLYKWEVREKVRTLRGPP